MSSRLRKGSQGRLVELLRRTTTQRSVKLAMGPEREYRIVTAGEDGTIIWWNLTAPYNGDDLSHVDRSIMREDHKLLVTVRPQQLTPVRSIHEIHLSETAQIYAIVCGPKMTTFVDNTGIITHYAVTYHTADE